MGDGIVTSAKGFAISCEPDRNAEIEQLVHPDEAETYGDLFELQRADAAHHSRCQQRGNGHLAASEPRTQYEVDSETRQAPQIGSLGKERLDRIGASG